MINFPIDELLAIFFMVFAAGFLWGFEAGEKWGDK